jgi:hypothetical protein
MYMPQNIKRRPSVISASSAPCRPAWTWAAAGGAPRRCRCLRLRQLQLLGQGRAEVLSVASSASWKGTSPRRNCLRQLTWRRLWDTRCSAAAEVNGILMVLWRNIACEPLLTHVMKVVCTAGCAQIQTDIMGTAKRQKKSA